MGDPLRLSSSGVKLKYISPIKHAALGYKAGRQDGQPGNRLGDCSITYWSYVCPPLASSIEANVAEGQLQTNCPLNPECATATAHMHHPCRHCLFAFLHKTRSKACPVQCVPDQPGLPPKPDILIFVKTPGARRHRSSPAHDSCPDDDFTVSRCPAPRLIPIRQLLRHERRRGGRVRDHHPCAERQRGEALVFKEQGMSTSTPSSSLSYLISYPSLREPAHH